MRMTRDSFFYLGVVLFAGGACVLHFIRKWRQRGKLTSISLGTVCLILVLVAPAVSGLNHHVYLAFARWSIAAALVFLWWSIRRVDGITFHRKARTKTAEQLDAWRAENAEWLDANRLSRSDKDGG